MPLLTPNRADALGASYVGVPFFDPGNSPPSPDPNFVDAVSFLKPIQDEVLNLIHIIYNSNLAVGVRNKSGSTLTAGPVSVTGWDHANQGYVIVAADAGTTKIAHLLLLTNLANNTSGTCYTQGILPSQLDTSASSLGANVWLASGGGVTLTEPGVGACSQLIGGVDTIGVNGDVGALIQPPSRIGQSMIKSATITGAEIAATTITAANIANATITGAKVASGTIAGSNIGANTVLQSNIYRSVLAGDMFLGGGSGADSEYRTMSADGSLSSIGALTIAGLAITADKMGGKNSSFSLNAAVGSLPRADGSGGVSFVQVGSSGGDLTNDTNNSLTLKANTVSFAKFVRGSNGQLVVGSTGADSAYQTLSGDIATISNAGVVTITSLSNLTGQVKTPTSVLMSSTSAPTSALGAFWQDSTQQCPVWFVGQSTANDIRAHQSATLFTQTANVNVNNTVTETTLLGSGIGTLTLPASFLVSGKTLRIKASGFLGTTGTPTLQLRVRLGGASGTLVGDSTAATLGSGLSNRQWSLEIMITCRGVNSVFAQGLSFLPTTTSTPLSSTVVEMTNTGTNGPTTGSSNVVAVTCTWGTASGSNTITCTNAVIEVLA